MSWLHLSRKDKVGAMSFKIPYCFLNNHPKEFEKDSLIYEYEYTLVCPKSSM